MSDLSRMDQINCGPPRKTLWWSMSADVAIWISAVEGLNDDIEWHIVRVTFSPMWLQMMRCCRENLCSLQKQFDQE